MAPEASDARDIARSYLMSLPDYRYLAARDLIAEHDLADTGNWLISARGIEDPILRVEKCSGQVTSLIA
ncbi:hypothetical protein D2V07_18210 [Aurantiacibacter zhengii]|uniref:Uncharacterized protein n=2 Tax=Aurantiacibacter zhengii TaxID=2307003 RepID=A0A418NMP0_9SPHN|nr:hypothetical protein D2V07_18210 [Aurantiacibacter zhengii]